MTLSIAVLISGTGSNLRAIHSAIEAGNCDASIAAVISDRRKAAGLEFAAQHGIPTRVVAMRDFADRTAWNGGLTEVVDQLSPDLVVLAGFMRIVDGQFVDRFEGRIINVHPALLPAFPGHNGPEQAIAARVRLSGCSVHLVDRGVDTGPVLAQAAVRVFEHDTSESLHKRIQKAEHRLLPKVIDDIARGAITLGEKPVLRHEPEEDDEIFYSVPMAP